MIAAVLYIHIICMIASIFIPDWGILVNVPIIRIRLLPLTLTLTCPFSLPFLSDSSLIQHRLPPLTPPLAPSTPLTPAEPSLFCLYHKLFSIVS